MKDKIRKRALAYVRISSLHQINNESPTTQRERIQKYADDNDIEIIEGGWFFDEAKSGKNTEREELKNLLNFSIKYRGKIDYVIVYTLSRASRDSETYYAVIKAHLRARGISIRSVMEPMVNDTKEGRFMETVMIGLAQLDNEGKSEITKDNMKALALQGYWLHPPIIGYDIHKIPNERGQLRPTLKPNIMAKYVTAVLVRFSQGDITKAKLTKYAAKIGLRSRYGNKLSPDRIHKLLKNPTYAGYVQDNFTESELVDGKHEPLITIDTFERNQKLLYPKNSRRGEVHVKKNGDYPLKSILKCTNCNLPLYGSAPKSGSGTYSPRYHCSRKNCRGIIKSVKTRQVHDDFEEMLKNIKPSEGVLKLYKTILVREANKELGRLNQHIGALRNELNKINTTRLNAIEKLAEGIISEQEKNELVDRLDSQKIDISQELENLEYQQNVRETDIELALNIMESVDRQWAESDIDVQIRFQNMLFPKGLVYDPKYGKFGTSEISPLYRYVANKKDLPKSEKSFLVAGAGLEPATLWL